MASAADPAEQGLEANGAAGRGAGAGTNPNPKPSPNLVGLEAVALVPLALGIKARLVAVAVPDPVWVAVRWTGAWLGLVLGLRARVKE